MATLYMRSETSGACWQIWPQPEPVAPGTVHETGRYVFELHGGGTSADADLLIDDVRLEALRSKPPVAARWRWEPGFHAGSVQAELRMPGAVPRRFEVVTDPDRRKLSRHDFDVMLREILDDTFALFSLSSFRKSVARGSGSRPPAIARLEFLRSRISELEESVAAIARRPRHSLAGEEVVLPYHRASRATGPDILRSLRSGKVLREEDGVTGLPESLNGFLPARIRTRRHVSSVDLPEHRQMAACLQSWTSWLGVAADLLERNLPTDDEGRNSRISWSSRCRQLARRVSSLRASPLFEAAGDAEPRLTMSPVFRNDPLYGRFYRIWQDIERGIAAVFGDFLDLPLARTFELYELWCFMRLVHAAIAEFGSGGADIGDLFSTDASGALTVKATAITIGMGNGWKISFQRQYREFWREPEKRGSYSRTMIPDVVMTREEAGDDRGQFIVLDAKYRINERLNDALSSVHMYRDALVAETAGVETSGIVRAAYLLAPHMPMLQAGYHDTPLPGRLFHPLYRRAFRFGAVSLMPGMPLQEIQSALRSIITDVGAGV
jgi:hypothetical protein